VLFITLWKLASKSGHVPPREKRKRLDIEDIASTPPADAADESNVEDREHFAFLFGMHHCRSTFEVCA